MTEQTVVATRHDVELKEPDMYQVCLHNDDYTPMDFVVDILCEIFRKSETAAHRVMMEIHEKGMGIGGVYTQDIAQTKVAQVHSAARSQEYPLRCSIQSVSGGRS